MMLQLINNNLNIIQIYIMKKNKINLFLNYFNFILIISNKQGFWGFGEIGRAHV